MTNLFNQGLLIAGIGMGLVFVALILLWGLMALMVRIRFKSDDKGVAAEPVVEAVPTAVETDLRDLRMQAAAAAVAAALGLRTSSIRIAQPAPKSLSPWQVARRSGQFSHNSTVTNRKSRGSAR